MRSLRLPLILLLFILVAVALFFFFRAPTRAAYGPAVALCPGPDLYGYTCESGAGYTYIDATNDSGLYTDDGMTTLALPFPFTFYGTTYSEVRASSNGNLQFTSGNPHYANQCLNEGPVAGLGDMIAPYWDDLDLRFYGYLETEVAGTAPDRIFVIEWDSIPRFGEDPEDTVTFAVQLFESSNDIVFLYEDVATLVGHNGSSATVGLQSEAQGLALQYSCNQAAVASASGLRFPHPTPANQDVGRDTRVHPGETAAMGPLAKGHVAELVEALNLRGPAALTQLRVHWLSQKPPRASDWRWLDLTGDGRDELVILWRGTQQYPHLAQVAVLAIDDAGQLALLLDEALSNRQELLAQVSVYETIDLTGDGQPDVVLKDNPTGQLFVVTAASSTPELLTLPERCRGSLGFLDTNGDGHLEVVRDGCAETQGRVMYAWDGLEFARRH